MHKWFTQKLNEMIGLAHYCQFPILKAHFILTQKAVDEMYGKQEPGENCLHDILPLMISQAEINGEFEAAKHLKAAYEAIEVPEKEIDNIVEIDFATPLKVQGHSSG